MTSPARVTVALIQMRCGDRPQANLEHACELIQEAASRGARIVCLPELFLSPYFCQTENHQCFTLAEPVPGPTTETLGKLAAQCQIVIVASIFEKRAEGIYHNTCAVLDADGRYLGKYRKMHIPDDPLYYEKFYFTPGDLGFKMFETRYARVGTLICWDQWFPEAARLTAMLGAELLVYPTAIGWHPSEKAENGQIQHDSWELIQRSHAVANGCYVVSINRVGHEVVSGGDAEAGIEFWGQSFACDTSGQVLVRGSHDQEEILLATINRDQIDASRIHWPFLRDRRIDAYGGLSQRYLDADTE